MSTCLSMKNESARLLCGYLPVPAAADEISDHVAAVIAALGIHPRARQLCLWSAYATAFDELALTYLAASTYAKEIAQEQAVEQVIAGLKDIIEWDFGTVECFESFTETLFDPASGLAERMRVVARFAVGEPLLDPELGRRAA